MNTVELWGEGASLQVSFAGKGQPSEGLLWVPCVAGIDIKTVRATVSTNLTCEEILAFSHEAGALARRESQKAVFMTLEGLFEFEVEGRVSGTAVVSGTLRLEGQPHASVSFKFESTVTAVEQFAARLAKGVPSVS